MGDEYVFGEVIPFGAAMMLCGVLTACACGGLAAAAAARGKHRHWLRDPSAGEGKFTDLERPYTETWVRGLGFMRWWTRILLPVLLCLPGGLAASVVEIDQRTTFLDALGGSVLTGLAFAFAFVLLALPRSEDGGA